MIEELSKELGWHEELFKLWKATQLTSAQPTVVKPVEGEVKGLAEQLGEVGADQQAPVPDTNPSDPTNLSITSGDKVESN